MAAFNKVILMGYLTRDPELKHTPGGTAVAEIGVAVNRKWFDKQTNSKKEETTFVDVSMFGRDAENAGQYLKKGSGVLVEGRLHLDQWDDKATGQKRSKLKVVAEQVQYLPTGDGGRRGGGSNRGNEDRQPAHSNSGPGDEVPW